MSYGSASLIDVPAIAFRVDGGPLLDGVTRFALRSELATPMTWLDLELDNRDGEGPVIARGARVELAPAYQGQDTLIVGFRGRVEDVRTGRVTSLSAVDDAVKLRDLTFTRSWRNVTPQDVLSDVCQAAGLDIAVASETQPRRGHFVSPGWNGLVVIAEVFRAWALPWHVSVEPAGTGYAGPWAASPQLTGGLTHTLFGGQDAAEVTPAGPDFGRGRAVVHLNPLFRCGHTLVLVDEQFSGGRMVARIDALLQTFEPHPSWPAYRSEVEWTRLA